MTVKVKICGLTRKSDVERAIELGADAVGFIYGYEDSPRNLSFEKLRELVAIVPPFVSTVVVSPSSNPRLNRVIADVKPSIVQLYHGGRSSQALGTVSHGTKLRFANIIQTVRPGDDEQDAGRIIEKCKRISKTCSGILFDSSFTSQYRSKVRLNHPEVVLSSGVGTAELWKLGRKVRDAMDPFPMILAGGLNEGNVGEAVRAVRPYAVDVSSGIEIKPGLKDEEKLEQFIRNAKQAIS